MTKEDIIRKLTSRKFWVVIGMFVVTLLVATGVISIDRKEELYNLIILGGTCVAYILGEGFTDVAHIKANQGYELEEVEEE